MTTSSTTDTPQDSQDVLRLPLRKLGLRSGMALQTRRLVEGTSKTEAQFFGAIEGKGVMVGPASSEAVQTGLSTGEVCVVRGFTGQYEFSFVSRVLQTFEAPFAYALLAYPAQVDAKQVRQSMRTKVAWPAELGTAQGSNYEVVALADLSPQGAMVRADKPLGNVGDAVTLRLRAETEAALVQLELEAKLCHHSCPPGGNQYVAGMSFQRIAADDLVKLHYLVSLAS
ncbi:PilZ domain-containing protein [Rhodoferax sp.]|uniref:PilZ domain-containing protein n=1 Tax=Rhodoferax sp. TaxID=50421 RepID=UPI0025FEB6E3|nr:PilZ domain-containing protein [Rhodoferax sp.]